ncbi:unnamed protein product [Closterium sp. NIES-53]
MPLLSALQLSLNPTHQAYVEGYLQAMLDTLYRQPYVTVKIANDTVVLKNLPPNTSLTNEMVTCVTDFLVTEGLLEPERGGGRDGGRGGRGGMGMPAAGGAAGGAGEVSAFRSLRRIHGEQMGPHNARVAVRALLEQLAVTLLIRTLRHQTARWLHVKPPPGTQADEGAATAAATGDGRGEEGQEEGRAGGGARERVGGGRGAGRVRAAVSHVVVASVVAYVDGRLCRHIPNAFLRRVVSGFLLSFVDL